jgi:hypothetical protein
MLNVHLYFLKLFGCHILDAGMPIDIVTFAAAIEEEKQHPNVYLKFGCNFSLRNNPIVGMSDVGGILDNSDGSCVFASWFYEVDRLAVNVMFAADGQKREGLVGAWHPRYGTNKLVIADFQ